MTQLIAIHSKLRMVFDLATIFTDVSTVKCIILDGILYPFVRFRHMLIFERKYTMDKSSKPEEEKRMPACAYVCLVKLSLSYEYVNLLMTPLVLSRIDSDTRTLWHVEVAQYIHTCTLFRIAYRQHKRPFDTFSTFLILQDV